MTDECSVEKYVEPKPCLVTCVQDVTKDGDTTTTKTTWTCSVHEPTAVWVVCVIGELNKARRLALEEAREAIQELKKH